MKVRIYPGATIAEFGAIRFECSWEVVRVGADLNDCDPDADILHLALAFETIEAARDHARILLITDVTAFGQVTIQKQVVDWFVEEDRVAEWADVGEPEYLCTGDFEYVRGQK